MSDHKLTPEQLQAIGLIAVRSASIEQKLYSMITWLAELDDAQEKAFLKNKMFMATLEMASTLFIAKLKDEDKIKAWTDIVGKIKKSNDERATAIHGAYQRTKPWNLQDFMKGDFFHTSDISAFRKNKVLHVDHLQLVADDLASVREELDAFWRTEFLHPIIQVKMAEATKKVGETRA